MKDTYLPSREYDALVRDLLEARQNPLDPAGAIKLALGLHLSVWPLRLPTKISMAMQGDTPESHH